MEFSKRSAASTLLFPDQQCLTYFDEITENKSKGLDKNAAIECYGNLHQSMDAIIKVIYEEKVHYDVVFQAPNKTTCALRDLYILELLKLGCVISKQTSPLNENVGFVLVLMPFWRLVTEAERIQLKLPLRSEEFHSVKSRFWGANKRPFFGIDRWRWIDLDGEIKALNGRFTANRMKYFLDRTSNINVDIFSNAQRNVLCFNIIHQITVSKDLDQDPLDLEGLVNLDVFTSYYPLHDGPADTSRKTIRSILKFSWKGWLKPQPVHEIREYFGERIAFHFAWMDHSTWWLFLLGIIGVFVFIYGLIKAVILNRYNCLIYD